MPRYATCRPRSTDTVKIHATQMIFIGIILSVVGTSSTVFSSQPRFMFSTRARTINSSSNVNNHIDIPNNAYFSPKSVSVEPSNVHINTKHTHKRSQSKRDIFDTCDEISDCFHLDDGHDECNPYKEQDEDRPFAFHANIKENIHVTSESPPLCSSSPPSSSSSSLPPFTLSFMEKKRMVSLRKMIQKATHVCHQTCPSVMYSSSNNRSANTSASRGIFGGTSTSVADDNNAQFASLLRLRKPKTESSKSASERTSPPSSTTTTQEIENQVGIEEEEEIIREPSQRILSGIIKPLIPTSIWNSLTGNEFYYPSTLSKLIQTGIKITTTTTTNGEDDNDTITILDEEEEKDGNYIDWKPADSKTKKLLSASNSKDDKIDIPDALLKEDQVLVWIGKFMTKKNGDEMYGSSLPLVKTISVIPLSPKKFAELLMDSSKVPLYNKMSLGRKDIVVFQQGVDTEADTNTIDENGTSSSMLRGGSGSGVSSFSLDGEAKIVRNVTKPPLSKKLMDFVTLMYARRLNENDNISPGYLGGSTSTGDSNDDSYIVVTRAVSGGRWSVGGGGGKDTTTESSSSSSNDDDKKEEMTRSEILLGVNLLRSIPGEPDKTEVTAVTHVYSPSVPKMLAGSVGVKGAIDFVKDIRALCG